MKIDFSNISIAVVGSVNLDIVARVKQFPEPGETLTDAVVSRYPGGKGGNQALAAHRLGAKVHMIACLGDDPAADEALATLANEGVNLDRCLRIDGMSTGLAIILVSGEGENQIVVAPGANAGFKPELLNIPGTDAVIAQLEVPMETVLKAARDTPGLFCLNAAPAKEVPPAVLDRTDLLVVNEIEARSIGRNLEGYSGLLATTYGSRGAVLSRKGIEIARAVPPEVKVVDTTGAGDAFTAALTVSLASGMPPDAAIDMACQCGALATTIAGAQSSPRIDHLSGRRKSAAREISRNE
jgi:ribokinase